MSATFTPAQLDYLRVRRVARLATADVDGAPHLLPLCFVATADTVYFSNGAERTRGSLKRVRNVEANPQVAVLVDHYREDWERIAYLLVHGRAELLREGPEHAEAARAFWERYPQMTDWPLLEWSVLAVRAERIVEWGKLASGGPDTEPVL
jgi:PPOX class probable F420-dependent enzyme